MPVIRTENASVAWRKEPSWGAGGSGSFKKFGNFEIVNAPDPEYEWYPFFGVFASRSREGIFRGRQTLRGSIPDIKMQGGRHSFLEMMLGRYQTGYYMEGKSSLDETIPSFELGVALKDTDGIWQPRRLYKGGLVNRWTLAANEGEELRYSIDEMLFKDMQHDMPGIAKYQGGLSWSVEADTAAGRYAFAECWVGMFGLTFSHVRRFSLTCDQQIEMRYYLARGGSADYQQVPNGYVPGKRVYRLEIDLDMSDPAIDRDVYEFLLNQGVASWPGYTVGTQVILDCMQTGSGEGTGRLIISAGTGLVSTDPGAVIVSAPYNIPAPPAGVPTVTVAFDVNSVMIYA